MSEKSLESRVEILETLAVELSPLPLEVRRLGDRMEGVESRLTTVDRRSCTFGST
jgi:hypothetical protein